MCMASICFWCSWLPELMKSSQFEVRELKLEALASDVLLLVSSFHYLVHVYFVECILPFCHVFNLELVSVCLVCFVTISFYVLI